MSPLGWLLQPAVLPWVALALGLCIGSFLNVVIHRLPKMMEREWRGGCAAPAGGGPPQGGAHNPLLPRSRRPRCGRALTVLANKPPPRPPLLPGRDSVCGARSA